MANEDSDKKTYATVLAPQRRKMMLHCRARDQLAGFLGSLAHSSDDCDSESWQLFSELGAIATGVAVEDSVGFPMGLRSNKLTLSPRGGSCV